LNADPFSQYLIEETKNENDDPFSKYIIQEKPSSIKEAAEFGTKGFTKGAIGTYGDLLDLFGLQLKPGQQTPGQEAYQRLEREAPEKVAPFLLESDEPVRGMRFPTSQEVGSALESIGLKKKPETATGRYAQRIGQFAGGALATGGDLLKQPLAAGLAGQTLEELGAPEWMQVVGEFIALHKTSPKSKLPVQSSEKEVESFLKQMRKTGYSEQDITLAKNALEERGFIQKAAKLTSEAENKISKAINTSNELYKEQLSKGLPGYAKGGMEYLDQVASDLYQTMNKTAETIPIKNTLAIKKSLQSSIDYLEKHPLTDEQKRLVKFLEEGLNKIDNVQSADFLTEYYRTLNREGKWLNPKQKEHVFRETKDAIKQTFKDQGPEGKKFAEYFEKTNESWKKWLNTKDALELLQKGEKLTGLDSKYILKTLDNPKNYAKISEAIGKKQADNLKTIAKSIESFKGLEKKLSKSKDQSILQGIKIIEGVKALFKGDTTKLASIATYDIAQNMATKLMTDEKYQNLMKKILLKAKTAPQKAALLANELIEDQ